MSDDVPTPEEREQQKRAAEAQSRTPGEPVPISDLLAPLARAKEAWERRRLSVIESDCPECQVDSAAARVCAFRGQDFCAHTAELQRRGRVKVLEANLRRGRVPSEHWKPIMSGQITTSSAVAGARRIIAEEGKLAIFGGTAGSGKSFGLALVTAECGGFFQPAAGLDPFGKKIDELLEHCLEVPLLGLDDAGAGRSHSDQARARLEQLVCQRWDDGKRTVITTNLARSDFWPLYGGNQGRIADRLNGDPVGWVVCNEESRRTGNPKAFNERAER